jgi:hypothetical protein
MNLSGGSVVAMIVSTDPTLPLPQEPRPAPPPPGSAPTARYPVGYRRRRHPARRSVIVTFSVIVLLILLVVADRVGNAIAENQFASQAQQAGLQVRPSVDITGFPFLTQFAQRDFRKVNFAARNVPAGPLEIASINATATGVHVNSSFNGAVVDHITGSGLVTFAAMANAATGGNGGTGLVTMTAAGPSKVQISAGPVSEDASIQRTGPNKISVQMVNNGDLLSGILSSFGSFSFTVPKLPGNMQITGLSVTTQGLLISFGASHAPLTQ